MQTALLTFEVFDELGSFVAAAILIRLKDKGWKAHIERLSRPRGGCLSSQYLAAWMIARQASVEDAEAAIDYAAPAGGTQTYMDRAMAAVRPFLPQPKPSAA